MKITIEYDSHACREGEEELFTEVLKVLSGYRLITDIVPTEEEVVNSAKALQAHRNGDAQQTSEQARQVSELDNAHVDQDDVLKDIQNFVAKIEESGLRTRKEIKEMLTSRGVNKFTELGADELIQIHADLKFIAATLED